MVSPCEIRLSVSTNAAWQEARIRVFKVLRVVTSGMMSIGVAVLGLVSWGRELEFSQAGPRRGRELRDVGTGG